MDDAKIFVKNKEELKSLKQIIRILIQDVREWKLILRNVQCMKEKEKKATEINRTKKKRSEVKSFKFLGILTLSTTQKWK